MIGPTSTNRHDMPLSRRAASSPFAVCAVLWAGVLLAGLASAADKPRPAASAAATKDTTPVLTQAQLRDCMTQKERLQQDTASALKTKVEVDAMKAEIDSTGDALSTEATTLDRTNADAVSVYNAKVGTRNALIDTWQAKVAAYNKDAEGVQATKETYARACENRRYDDRDLNDLQKKK
jgi:hypothetical protein